MDTKVLILSEGGKRYGFGHISRCISLYQAFEAKGATPEIIINGDESVHDLLINYRLRIFNWLQNEDFFELTGDPDVLVIDSYLASEDLVRSIATKALLALFLDDNQRIIYPPGIILNGAFFAPELNYHQNYNQCLLGERYAILRQPFWDVPVRKVLEIPESLLITVGGSDIRNLMPCLLNTLCTHFPSFQKKVVTTVAFNNLEAIDSAADQNTEIIFNPSASKMKDLMVSSDIAVSSAGQTIYELSAVGVPTVNLTVADNQINNAIACSRLQLSRYSGHWNDPNLESNVVRDLKDLMPYEIRVKLNEAFRSRIDGRGAIRVADFCLAELERRKAVITYDN
ncbi:MAG: glycosyltransferase [Saprospiraceae bacterium]